MSYKLFARKLNLNLLFRNFLISCIFFNMSKSIFSKKLIVENVGVEPTTSRMQI